jgi:hypothetical protein
VCVTSVLLGYRSSLEQQITEMTRIPIEAVRGQALSRFNIDERFSWIQKRQTTKEEDKAYCLLGVFNASLSLIYGGGHSNAMRRLRKETTESMSKPQSTSTASKAFLCDVANCSLSSNAHGRLNFVGESTFELFHIHRDTISSGPGYSTTILPISNLGLIHPEYRWFRKLKILP